MQSLPTGLVAQSIAPTKKHMAQLQLYSRQYFTTMESTKVLMTAPGPARMIEDSNASFRRWKFNDKALPNMSAGRNMNRIKVGLMLSHTSTDDRRMLRLGAAPKHRDMSIPVGNIRIVIRYHAVTL